MIWKIIIISIILSTLIFSAFLMGFYFGIKSNEVKEKKIINPIKKIQEKKYEEEILESEIKEQEKIAIMLENIENYDGTGLGQKDLPK